MTFAKLDEIPLCYASPSLGMHASHTLPKKIEAISKAGYQALEMAMPDLLAYAGLESDDESPAKLREAATEIGRLCREAGLKVLVLQPHSQFEGYTDPEVRKGKLARAERWLTLMEPLGCDMLQVGSNDDTSTSSDLKVIAGDLRDLSDLAKKYGDIRVAYEPWCWGAHVNTWRQCYDVMKLVDRANFGLNLDTFQIAGREWADPGNASGLLSDPEREANFSSSLADLTRVVKAEEIFFLQISDGYKKHITRDHPDWNETTPGAREIWSHSYRPLPYDSGRPGYLPVKEVTQAILATGFRGWFSYEVFLDEMKEESFDLEAFARLGIKSHARLMADCGA